MPPVRLANLVYPAPLGVADDLDTMSVDKVEVTDDIRAKNFVIGQFDVTIDPFGRNPGQFEVFGVVFVDLRDTERAR